MTHKLKTNPERGFVSIFTVLFFILILTIITIGFLRIMLQEQRQSTNNNLSQNAYDAAMSGIEDGKRAYFYAQQACATGNRALCDQYTAIFDSEQCDGLWDPGRPQVKAQMGLTVDSSDNSAILSPRTSNDNSQRYTCLLVSSYTSNYLDHLNEDQSRIIPMTGESNTSQVVVKWHSKKDRADAAATLPSAGQLLQKPDWNAADKNNPPVLRVQLMEVPTGGNILLNGAGSLDTYSKTVFLYPSSSGGAGNTPVTFVSRDLRDANSNNPQTILSPVLTTCTTTPDAPYSCEITLSFGNSGDNTTKYLRVTPLYKGTDYELQLKDSSGAAVRFKGVQTEIDSTGRANDVFRRVKARVGAKADGTLNAVETARICKDMIVSTDPRYFKDNCHEVPPMPAIDCVYYAVDDIGRDDSQFMKIDPNTDVVSLIGPTHRSLDLEGLDVQPLTGKLYGFGGSSADSTGTIRTSKLYEINTITGAYTQVADTGRIGLSAASFHPLDGELYSWSRNTGLIKVNITTGATTTVLARTGINVEAITWDNTGQKLYASADNVLYEYDAATRSLRVLSNTIPVTEALEMRPDNYLIGGIDNKDVGSTSFYLYDVNTLQIVTNYRTPQLDDSRAYDIESIAYPENCSTPRL